MEINNANNTYDDHSAKEEMFVRDLLNMLVGESDEVHSGDHNGILDGVDSPVLKRLYYVLTSITE